MNGGTEMDVRGKLIELLTNSQQLDGKKLQIILSPTA